MGRSLASKNGNDCIQTLGHDNIFMAMAITKGGDENEEDTNFRTRVC
jgi:aromatic ring hydroxylase